MKLVQWIWDYFHPVIDVKIPKSLDEAVEYLYNQKVRKIDHFTQGMAMRNHWNLWSTTSPLNQWFRENLKILHADDMSMIIEEALAARIAEVAYNPMPTVRRCHQHWRNYGFDPLTMKQVGPCTKDVSVIEIDGDRKVTVHWKDISDQG